MADRSTKPIKDVLVGDKVKATDVRSGETEGKSVTALHLNHDRDLVDVTVSGAAKSAVLHTTAHHPFWDETDKAWVRADGLVVRHRLRSFDGTVVTVAGVGEVAGDRDMVDLTVDDVHTYYVIAGNTPVLVHNCDVSSVGGVDAVTSCEHLCLGVNPHSDDLAAQVGGHTVNGPAWGGTKTASGRPIWMDAVSAAAGNRSIRISFTLDGLNGADGGTIAGSAQEAFDVNYTRGVPMTGDWRIGAGAGNGTAWELATVGRAVRLGNREWSSIDWYWQGKAVDLADPFA